MLLALCSKVLEAEHFCDGAMQEWRDSAHHIADVWFDFIISMFGQTEQGKAAQAAWAAQKDYCERFGYRSGPVYEVLAPHHLVA